MNPIEWNHELAQIGDRLIVARAARGWSQHELARRAGLDPGTVKRIERRGRLDGLGPLDPRISTVIQLAAALELDPSWLTFGERDTSDADST